MTRERNAVKRDLLISVSFFAVALCVHLAFLTAHYSYDSVAGGILLYQWLASGRVAQLFHRYHVLYLPTAAAAEALLSRLGILLDPLTLLQVSSAVSAAASLGLYYRLARALGIDPVLSATTTVLLGAGFSYGYYASNGESYPISLVFLLLAYLAAVRPSSPDSLARSCLPGAWLGLAAAFHGTCLLALPGLAVMTWSPPGERRRYRRTAILLLATGIVLGVPYAARYLLVSHGNAVSGVDADASALAAEAGWSMPPRLLVQWMGLVRSMAPAAWPALPSAHSTLVHALDGILLGVTLLPLALLFGVEASQRRRAFAVAVWLLSAFLFFASYYAGSPKFASYQWAPLLLLVALAVQRIGGSGRSLRLGRSCLAAIAGLVVLANADLIRRQADPESNPHLVRARAIARLTESRDLVLHLGRGDDQYQNVYTPYFAVRPSLSLDPYFGSEAATRALESRLRSFAAGGGRIVAFGDAIEPSAAAREFETAHHIPEGSLALFFANLRPQRLSQDPAVGSAWLLTAPGSPP
jgi:hypothetical protein